MNKQQKDEIGDGLRQVGETLRSIWDEFEQGNALDEQHELRLDELEILPPLHRAEAMEQVIRPSVDHLALEYEKHYRANSLLYFARETTTED